MDAVVKLCPESQTVLIAVDFSASRSVLAIVFHLRRATTIGRWRQTFLSCQQSYAVANSYYDLRQQFILFISRCPYRSVTTVFFIASRISLSVYGSN